MNGHTREQAPELCLWLTRCLIALFTATCMQAAAQTPVWSEEFDTGLVPDPSIWSYDIGTGDWGWGNWELQNYTSNTNNVRVEGGNLIISAVRSGNSFTSGRIKTLNKLTFKYATVEARIKTPDLANGLWPAFWTLGNNFPSVGWPDCGEIDVMEMGQAGAIADGTVNRRVGSAGHFEKNGDHQYKTKSIDRPADINDTFVIYRMEWTPTTISTYIDNVHIWTMDISDPETSDLEEFHEPHFLLLNMAVGGTYTGIFDAGGITALASGESAEYVIDYIRIYGNGNTIISGPFSNLPPVFTTDPFVRSNAYENGAYSDTIADSATDADGNHLIYTKVSGPDWLNVAPDGTLSGTPGIADLGFNSWTVEVSDSFSSPVSAALEITVINVNDDPVFFLDTFSKPNAAENTAYSNSISGTATDVDVGDTLTYSKVSGPDWLNVATNGALSGTPDDLDTGLNSWTVQASDGNGGSDTATLEITVDDVQHDPVFTIDPIIRPDTDDSLYPGTTNFYTNTITGSATDEDAGDILTYSHVSGPRWLEVIPSGLIAGYTDGAAPGLNIWTVQVDDGNGGTDTAELHIWVGRAPTPPVLSIQMSGSNLELLWPSSVTGFSLYGSTNLMPPVVWSSVTNTPVMQGDDWRVSIPIVEAPPFFRLQNP